MSLLQTAFALVLALTLFMGGAAPASAASWKFAVLCDDRSSYAADNLPAYYDAAYGISPYFQNVALALSREEDLDFVLFPGDLFRGKKPTMTGAQMAAVLDEWNSLMQPVYDAGIPVYAIRGNHDAYEVSDPAGPNGNAVTIWRNHLSLSGNTINPITRDTGDQSGLSYAFMHKGSLFVGLDEYVGGLSYDRAFLNSQLIKRARHQFVFAHQPLWDYKADELGPAGLADELNSGNVDLYFSGHVHSYQRIRENGYRFQEIIIGTGGAPQDNPTLDATGAGYVADPNLTVINYAGGKGGNARFGYAVITVNDDGSVTGTMKFLNDPTSATSTVSDFDTFMIPAK
jgi:predicted phosphodiesterase